MELNSLLDALSDAAPCGDNLEYDPAFAQLLLLGAGKPEQQIGDTLVPAEEPDWRQVLQQAEALLGRTKDLRVASWWTKAALRLRGFSGFADGLSLVHGMLDRFWDQVHPQIDPDDGDDPTMRVNALMELCDPDTTLAWLRKAPLVSARGVGVFTLRDVALATGEAARSEGDEEASAQMAAVEAACLGCDLQALRDTAEALGEARQTLAAIEAIVSTHVVSAGAPNFSRLSALLAQAARFVDERLAQRQAASGEMAMSDDAAQAAAGPSRGEVAPLAGGAAPRPAGEVRTRDDVVAAIDRICAYYARHEPSSPVPMLLRRARRLVNMEFFEIVRNLAPDGISQVEMLRGPMDGEA